MSEPKSYYNGCCRILDFAGVEKYEGLVKLDILDEILNHPLFGKRFIVPREGHYELTFSILN